LVTLEELAAFRGNFASGCFFAGHRFAPRGGAERETGRLTLLFAEEATSRSHKSAPLSFLCVSFPAAFISLIGFLTPGRKCAPSLLANSFPTGGSEATVRIFRPQLHRFVFECRARCFLAAFILSVGILDPPFCRGLALVVSLMWRLFLRAALSHGSFTVDFIGPAKYSRQAGASFTERLRCFGAPLRDQVRHTFRRSYAKQKPR
jgi:hypothetical protein